MLERTFCLHSDTTLFALAILDERVIIVKTKPKPSNAGNNQAPPTLGVHMKCCNIYIYARINPAREAYVGWCPRCTKQVRIEIVSEGGSTNRIFEAE